MSLILPKSVVIFGSSFLVVEEPLTDPDCVGISNYNKRQIRVDSALSDEVKIETLYHEVAHMMMASTGMSGVLEAACAGYEEAFADFMGKAMYRFAEENELHQEKTDGK